MDIPTIPTACIGDGRPERPPEGLTKPSAIHYLDMYANQPDDDSLFVAEDTLKERNRAWNSWTRISFSITPVPSRAFCLASLILTQAINDQGFEAGYNAVEEIFDKPNLETVDFIPLKWRPVVKDQEVFRLSDSMLAELFHRTLLVIGIRRSPRYYSLRVGCGARLDGVLSNALRNYVLSHTTDVFESSYQPNHVRTDLMNLAFGSEAGGSDDLLFAMLEEENAFKWRKDK
ncbi:hypothetical protein F4680DRAFT_446151 [Xylaria scruposa]|nr:hypothetical protein F4680DRAFT_446151 [Xylaria scruposa]